MIGGLWEWPEVLRSQETSQLPGTHRACDDCELPVRSFPDRRLLFHWQLFHNRIGEESLVNRNPPEGMFEYQPSVPCYD